MTIVTISSVHGSPGATSWSLLLAGAWPSESALERVVVEADCDGGVLGARYQIGVDPGAVSLISACRRHDGSPTIADHGRPLAEGVWMVPGPEVAEQAVPAWQSGAADVADRLEDDPRIWLFDLGRFRAESPVAPLVARSSLNLVITGSRIEDIVQVPARVESLTRSAPTGVILVGKSAHDEDELHRFFGGRALWAVPAGENLPSVAMRALQGGRARRTRSWRAALDVAADVATLLAGAGRREKPRSQPPMGTAEPSVPRPDPEPVLGSGPDVEPLLDPGSDGPARAGGPPTPGPVHRLHRDRPPVPGRDADPEPTPAAEPDPVLKPDPATEPSTTIAMRPAGGSDDAEISPSPAVRAAAEYADRVGRRPRSRWTP